MEIGGWRLGWLGGGIGALGGKLAFLVSSNLDSVVEFGIGK